MILDLKFIKSKTKIYCNDKIEKLLHLIGIEVDEKTSDNWKIELTSNLQFYNKISHVINMLNLFNGTPISQPKKIIKQIRLNCKVDENIIYKNADYLNQSINLKNDTIIFKNDGDFNFQQDYLTFIDNYFGNYAVMEEGEYEDIYIEDKGHFNYSLIGVDKSKIIRTAYEFLNFMGIKEYIYNDKIIKFKKPSFLKDIPGDDITEILYSIYLLNLDDINYAFYGDVENKLSLQIENLKSVLFAYDIQEISSSNIISNMCKHHLKDDRNISLNQNTFKLRFNPGKDLINYLSEKDLMGAFENNTTFYDDHELNSITIAVNKKINFKRFWTSILKSIYIYIPENVRFINDINETHMYVNNEKTGILYKICKNNITYMVVILFVDKIKSDRQISFEEDYQYKQFETEKQVIKFSKNTRIQITDYFKDGDGIKITYKKRI